MDPTNYDEVSQMFRERLEKELAGEKAGETTSSEDIGTRDYEHFKKQYLPHHLNIYEKICQFSEKLLPFKPDKAKIKPLQEAINTCHINTSPTGVYSTSIVLPLALVFASIFIFFIIPAALGGTGNIFFVMFSLITALVIMVPLQKLPFTLANSWRMKASNQMVLSVFYMVTYMRHTSNLELAINFAADHLAPPLSLDLRKIIWNVETEKYDSVKESLGAYMDAWRKFNMEFVESIHLIESSLYETSEERRLNSLDKSLAVILDETFEKMLHYAHNLKGPLTTLNMLGVVLPILTLVILPLVVSFMDNFRWYHLFAMYNIALPIIVYSLGKKILSTRPGGSGQEDITKKNPELKKYTNIVIKMGDSEAIFKPQYLAVLMGLMFLLIGFLPIIWNTVGLPDYALVDNGEHVLSLQNVNFIDKSEQYVPYYFLNYREQVKGDPTKLIGPFGLGAMLLSIFIPLGLGYSFGFYYKSKSKNIIKIREQAKKLEVEFSAALFQLGSRVGDGIPAEIAFGKVAEVMEDTVSGQFFSLVHANITRLGMNVENAIFDKEKGALKYYPSDLIESSMKVLVESSKKGPQVASKALINVSEYIKQMHRVDERLKDLMGDVISSMKSQVRFLTPVISGIVVGITSMITGILGSLGDEMKKISAQSAAGNVSGAGLLGMFGTGIPTYQFQIVVGLYVIQLSYILTVIANGIENGPDKIGEQYELGQNLMKSSMLYAVLAFIVIIIFNVVAGSMLGNLTG